jgi:ubiquitin-protein ligase
MKWTQSEQGACISDKSHSILLMRINSLPFYEDVQIQILITIPELYPSQSPPQLQLLSRYIGAFGIDPDLFGDILKTFISSKSGVEFIPGSVVVFDGLQSVLEQCSKWYRERLSEKEARNILREEQRNQQAFETTIQKDESTTMDIRGTLSSVASLPEGIQLVEAEAITDRRSVFVGRACRITHPSQVSPGFSQSTMTYLVRWRRF